MARPRPSGVSAPTAQGPRLVRRCSPSDLADMGPFLAVHETTASILCQSSYRHFGSRQAVHFARTMFFDRGVRHRDAKRLFAARSCYDGLGYVIICVPLPTILTCFWVLVSDVVSPMSEARLCALSSFHLSLVLSLFGASATTFCGEQASAVGADRDQRVSKVNF